MKHSGIGFSGELSNHELNRNSPPVHDNNLSELHKELTKTATENFRNKCCKAYLELHAEIGALSIDALLDEVGDALADIQYDMGLMAGIDIDIGCDRDMDERSKESNTASGSFVDDTAVKAVEEWNYENTSDSSKSDDNIIGIWYDN